ncbi:hypothetical protein B0H19DRAFT_1292397 [Mycena capillaripes]|nr:hypothetical protein B0H19DRAFT_1292397 [Mycena capillaripes]
MSSDPSPSPAVEQDKYRLPTNVKPTHYNLSFWTDLESLKFGGFVTVDSIHCAALEVDQLQSLQIANQEGGRVTLNFFTALPTGSKAQLKIDYNAKLCGSLNGYYKCGWKKDGKTEYYALTHFQPTDARAAFPCFDEPALKSTWTITMISRSDTVNISNMSVESEVGYDPVSAALDMDLVRLLSTITKDVQWKITKFQKTPPMSSYLVAFANATPDIVHQAEFCLDVMAKVLPLYEKIFDIGYPLPKLDTLANWGLITGRTHAFLLDPQKTCIDAQKWVAKWWDNLYLNEGFASLVHYKVFPEWEVNSTFISAHLNRGLMLDAKQSSHPIEIFDSLSYSKAASEYIREERFLKGVSLYLKNHLPGNTVTQDLWAGISTATSEDITRLMSNWIVKTGFPLITVTETLSGIHVRQDRFLNSGPDANDETIWCVISVPAGSKYGTYISIRNVPLAILTVDKDGKAHIDKSAILEEKETTFAIDVTKNFKLNAETTGFYRVLYTPEHLSKIVAEAAKEDTVFSLSDRIGLIYDVLELAKAGMTKLSSFFTLVDIWRSETNCKYSSNCCFPEIHPSAALVWESILTGLNGVARAFEIDAQIDTTLRGFMHVRIVPSMISDVPKLRGRHYLRRWWSSVTQELRSRFAEYMKTGEDTMMPSNIKGIIFTAAARAGGREEFEALLNIIEITVNPADKKAAIAAIGSTQYLGLVQELFSYILTKACDQDVISYFAGLEHCSEETLPNGTASEGGPTSTGGLVMLLLLMCKKRHESYGGGERESSGGIGGRGGRVCVAPGLRQGCPHRAGLRHKSGGGESSSGVAAQAARVVRGSSRQSTAGALRGCAGAFASAGALRSDAHIVRERSRRQGAAVKTARTSASRRRCAGRSAGVARWCLHRAGTGTFVFASYGVHIGCAGAGAKATMAAMEWVRNQCWGGCDCDGVGTRSVTRRVQNQLHIRVQITRAWRWGWHKTCSGGRRVAFAWRGTGGVGIAVVNAAGARLCLHRAASYGGRGKSGGEGAFGSASHGEPLAWARLCWGHRTVAALSALPEAFWGGLEQCRGYARSQWASAAASTRGRSQWHPLLAAFDKDGAGEAEAAAEAQKIRKEIRHLAGVACAL